MQKAVRMTLSTTIGDSAVVSSLDTVLGTSAPVVSVAPVTLDAPHRPFPLDVRVSAPATGQDLPVLLFSHGNGWSLDGHSPLAAYWAAQGFVVIQPTHLDSRRYGIGFDDERFGTIWTQRYDDLVHVIDQLGTIEHTLPGLAGRVDHRTIVAAGRAGVWYDATASFARDGATVGRIESK